MEQRDARKVPLRIVLAVCFAFRNATPQGTSIRQYVERVSNKLYHTRSLAQVKKELEKAQMQLVFLHNKQQINSCSQESSIASGPCKTTPGEESPSSNRIMSIKQAIYKSPFQSTPESILISVRMYLVEATKVCLCVLLRMCIKRPVKNPTLATISVVHTYTFDVDQLTHNCAAF